MQALQCGPYDRTSTNTITLVRAPPITIPNLNLLILQSDMADLDGLGFGRVVLHI